MSLQTSGRPLSSRAITSSASKTFRDRQRPRSRLSSRLWPAKVLTLQRKDVLKQVVAEEVQEIEKNLKGTIKQHALATVTNQPSESESSSESDDQAEELTNKPVQREKKKTQTEINKKVSILTLPSDV